MESGAISFTYLWQLERYLAYEDVLRGREGLLQFARKLADTIRENTRSELASDYSALEAIRSMGITPEDYDEKLPFEPEDDELDEDPWAFLNAQKDLDADPMGYDDGYEDVYDPESGGFFPRKVEYYDLEEIEAPDEKEQAS